MVSEQKIDVQTRVINGQAVVVLDLGSYGVYHINSGVAQALGEKLVAAGKVQPPADPNLLFADEVWMTSGSCFQKQGTPQITANRPIVQPPAPFTPSKAEIGFRPVFKKEE